MPWRRANGGGSDRAVARSRRLRANTGSRVLSRLRRSALCAMAAMAAVLGLAWAGSATFEPSRAQWAPDGDMIRTALVTRRFTSSSMRDESGWPFRAFACEYPLAKSPRGELYATGVRWGILLAAPPPPGPDLSLHIRAAATYARALPLQPLPLGLAADLAALFLPIAAVSFLPRARAVRPEGGPRVGP